MSMASPAPSHFLETVGPLLATNNGQEVLRALQCDWPPDRLVALLISPDIEVARAAVVCLGLTGAMRHCRYVASMLHDSREALWASAETSLWQIWMRAGSEWGRRMLRRAVDRMSAEDYSEARRLLDVLALAEPEYAEAHHQRGLTSVLTDCSCQALQSYRQALRLNPYHFAAAQGLGQVYLDRGLLPRALEYYEYALNIHPRLE
ncbi:MAG: hypothetical protein JXO22_12280, partial [Phycisphaerae bacterium]|nr:hypothetical protein [Phycisphaerae bacterium]